MTPLIQQSRELQQRFDLGLARLLTNLSALATKIGVTHELVPIYGEVQTIMPNGKIIVQRRRIGERKCWLPRPTHQEKK